MSNDIRKTNYKAGATLADSSHKMCAGIATGHVALCGLSFLKSLSTPDVSMATRDMIRYELLFSFGMVFMSSFVKTH